MTAEKNFEGRIKSYLSRKGAWFIKYWAGAKYTKEGIPDILACVEGKFYGIEIKAPTGKPSLLQLVTLRNIRESGGIGILLYPDDLKYFIEFINGSDIGNYWYKENKKKQQEWFDKLNK